MSCVLAAVLFALVGGIAGCSFAPVPVDDPASWVARHGGPADAALASRANAAARRLTSGGQSPVRRLLIAADRGIGAWSWPDGTVVLTWGLMDSLDDGALVAALAHEVGHNELGIRPGPASLAGGRGLVIERAADRAGAALLAARGLDPATMPRMLRLVAARVGEQTKAGRAALSRAGNLEAELSAGRLGQARGTRPRSSR